jgi:hypothetical protein
MKGYKSDFPPVGYYDEDYGEWVRDVETISLNYLEIPVLAKLSMLNLGNATFNLFAGTALTVELSSKLKVEEIQHDTGRILHSESFAIDLANNVDVGLVLGVGTDFNINQGKLVVDVQYNWGLREINFILMEKNRVFSFIVGYYF